MLPCNLCGTVKRKVSEKQYCEDCGYGLEMIEGGVCNGFLLPNGLAITPNYKGRVIT